MKSFGSIRAAWVLAITLGLTGASCIRPLTPDSRPLTSKEPDTTATAKVQAAYGKLPLHFEANQGQTDKQVKFLSRGSGYTLFLTPTEAVLALHKPESKAKACPELSRRGKGQKAKGKREEQRRVGMAHQESEPKLETRNSKLETVVRMQLTGANPQPQKNPLAPASGERARVRGIGAEQTAQPSQIKQKKEPKPCAV